MCERCPLSELAHEDAVRDLKQENDKNVTKLRQQYEREVRRPW